MTDGIVLAAGFSSRAKTNKMLLEYLDKPIILHTIQTMHQFCERVIVVTGCYHEEIERHLRQYNYIDFVYNENYKKGMFSSIQAGVLKTKHNFFIIPGDYPNVKASTYQEILENQSMIVVPSYRNKLGHPIYFDRTFKNKILETDHESLKDFRNSFEFRIVTVNDPGILFDVDDLNDYKILKGKE
jgi:molybdenum cofactor cytidylyltransferase